MYDSQIQADGVFAFGYLKGCCTLFIVLESESVLQNALSSFNCNSLAGMASQKYRTQL